MCGKSSKNILHDFAATKKLCVDRFGSDTTDIGPIFKVSFFLVHKRTKIFRVLQFGLI